MCGVVVFNYANWAVRYPELSAWVSSALAQLYFNEAQLCCDNTPSSPVQCLTTRSTLLNMATAHVAQLNAPLNGQASSQIVGRPSSITQGSTSISTVMDASPGASQWWNQTKYGAAFWAATIQYRTFRYNPSGRQSFGYPMGSRRWQASSSRAERRWINY